MNNRISSEMKRKIYHIHTDYKFLEDSYRFDDELFANVLIIIGQKKPDCPLNYDFVFFSLCEFDEAEIIKKISKEIIDADLVVLNGLCPIKRKIIKISGHEHKIAWRFFGYELYGKRKDLMFDNQTYQLVENKGGKVNRVVKVLRKIKRKYQNYRESLLVKKIDYIFLFCNEEYNFLQKYWSVPKFIQLNIMNYPMNWNVVNHKKKPVVIIGNSRSPYNNHIEILNIIRKNHSEGYNFVLFFSYGSDANYTQAIKELVEECNNVSLIEEFLSKEKFASIYDTASVFVINSYRQMALGNIFTALGRGVKVYLNPQNVIKDWLDKEGFRVFSTDDFENDLKNHQLMLTREQMKDNLDAFQAQQNKFNKSDFNHQILDFWKEE